ncbi:MAG: TolC family protein [Candidatus Omnitrophica bacterium]|nr:TolC family protein [Candidatus Omnitrophota bacterium]
MKAVKSLVIFFLFGLFFFNLTTPACHALAKKPSQKQTRTSEANIVQEPTLFTLSDCYQLALKRSETIAISKETVEEAEAEFFKSTAELFGDVDFLITDFRQDSRGSREGGATGTSSVPHRRERKFVITQPLFQGFRSIAALGAAGSLKKQRKQEWVRAKQLLFRDVVLSFFSVLERTKDVEIADGIHQALEGRIKELEARERIGRSRASELATAISRMKLIESDLARSRGALAIALHTLEFLIGTSVRHEQLKDNDLPSDTISDLETYLDLSEERPDVEASRQATKTAWNGVIEAQSDLWPEISLESNRFIKREGFQKDIDWDLLLKFNLPLSRGGETVGNIKQAVSSWKKAKLNHSLARRGAELDIKDAYQNWKTSAEELKAIQAAVDASEKNFDLQKEEYARNLVSNLDVLVALEELYNTRREANRIYYGTKQSYWDLQVARGYFDEPR